MKGDEQGWPAERRFEARARLGEGPVWDAAAGRLLWVDIYNNRVHRFDPERRAGEVLSLPEIVPCVAPAADGRLLVALRNDLALFTPETGDLERLATREADRPGNRFNDGAVDARGRFWIGTMNPDRRGQGALYRLDPDGSVTTVETGLSISNGIGWSPDGGTLYLTDSPEKRIYAYDFDEQRGTLSHRRVHVDLGDADHFPDGLAVDAEGCIWSAQWDGACVIRFDLRGREIDRLTLPVPRPTSCAFGGPDLRTLFITSASVALSEQQIQDAPLSGDLFWADVGVAGLPRSVFRDP